MREPLVSGQFYASGFSELDKQINSCFDSKLGPASLPVSKRSKKVLGIISPHAGYMFSGPCAAWAYKEIAESEFPDTFIMLGLSHNGRNSCLSLEDWKTPFGIVKPDRLFQKTLSKISPLVADEAAHSSEHSIEVQLPFLQFSNRDKLNEINIAPIICSPDMDYKQLASYILDAVNKTKRKVAVICSSDFTHYGFNYGYVPFNEDIKKNMYELDNGAINLIKNLDADRFLDYTEETGATICGKYPIAVLIELAKMLGAKKASLLRYYTSGDVIGDYSSAVGYASIRIS